MNSQGCLPGSSRQKSHGALATFDHLLSHSWRLYPTLMIPTMKYCWELSKVYTTLY